METDAADRGVRSFRERRRRSQVLEIDFPPRVSVLHMRLSDGAPSCSDSIVQSDTWPACQEGCDCTLDDSINKALRTRTCFVCLAFPHWERLGSKNK